MGEIFTLYIDKHLFLFRIGAGEFMVSAFIGLILAFKNRDVQI